MIFEPYEPYLLFIQHQTGHITNDAKLTLPQVTRDVNKRLKNETGNLAKYLTNGDSEMFLVHSLEAALAASQGKPKEVIKMV